MSTQDVQEMLSELHVLDLTRSIFETSTRASRMIEAAKGSSICVTWDRPHEHEVKVTMKNTYQLGPKEIFNTKKANDVAKIVVAKWITKDPGEKRHKNHYELQKPSFLDTTYEVEWARTTAKAIAQDVQDMIKKLDYDRYKFVVQAFIGQKRRHAVKCCSRFLFDAKLDRYAEYKYENDTLWCIVFTSAMYYE